jgi:hypothetical protein
MEVVYQGPRSHFAEFGSALCEISGVDEYTVEGVIKKGWVTDEIVRYVIQFDPDEAHSQIEILTAAIRWAANKSSAIHVTTENNEAESQGDEIDKQSDEG